MALHDPHLPRTILKSVASALFTALMATCAKLGSDRGLTTVLMVFWYAWVPLVISIPIVLWQEPKGVFFKKLRTKRMGLHVLRSVFGWYGISVYILVLHTLSIATTTVLVFTIPFFMPFIAFVWKRRPLPHWGWIGIAIGFLGVACVVQPGRQIFQVASLIALTRGVVGGCGQFSVHLLATTEPRRRINFFLFLFGAIGSGAVILFDPSYFWGELLPIDYAILTGIGLSAFGYVYFLTSALKEGSPNLVTTLLYVSVVFGIVADWVIWRTLIDWLTLLGVILIVVGVILMVLLQKIDTKKANSN